MISFVSSPELFMIWESPIKNHVWRVALSIHIFHITQYYLNNRSTFTKAVYLSTMRHSTFVHFVSPHVAGQPFCWEKKSRQPCSTLRVMRTAMPQTFRSFYQVHVDKNLTKSDKEQSIEMPAVAMTNLQNKLCKCLNQFEDKTCWVFQKAKNIVTVI